MRPLLVGEDTHTSRKRWTRNITKDHHFTEQKNRSYLKMSAPFEIHLGGRLPPKTWQEEANFEATMITSRKSGAGKILQSAPCNPTFF